MTKENKPRMNLSNQHSGRYVWLIHLQLRVPKMLTFKEWVVAPWLPRKGLLQTHVISLILRNSG